MSEQWDMETDQEEWADVLEEEKESVVNGFGINSGYDDYDPKRKVLY
jgi:hypothetical protein